MRNRTSDLRIPRSDALPLSHRDSTLTEVCYEVHMTRALHTARISNVDSVLINKRDVKFLSSVKEQRKMFFVLSRAWDKEKIVSPYQELNL